MRVRVIEREWVRVGVEERDCMWECLSVCVWERERDRVRYSERKGRREEGVGGEGNKERGREREKKSKSGREREWYREITVCEWERVCVRERKNERQTDRQKSRKRFFSE